MSSLGGAMATLCALDLRLNLKMPDVRVYTFGSPRVGNLIFAQWFEGVVQVRCRHGLGKFELDVTMGGMSGCLVQLAMCCCWLV
jgi:predicted lipase